MNDTTVQEVNPAGRAQTQVTPLPNLTAMLWIAWFSLREMSRRKRIISLGAINLLPVLVVVIIRVWFPDQGITAHMLLSALTHEVFINFLIPVVAIAVGVSCIGEQVEEGTIVYLWTRPVRRRAIYMGRLLAAQSVATLLLSGSLVFCFLVMLSNGLSIITWDLLVLYFRTFLIIALGAFSYTALFAAIGTFLKKPVVPAILFTFVWEGMVSEVPARIQELSLRFHLQNLVSRPDAPVEDLPGLLGALLSAALQREPVPKVQSIIVLLVVMLVAIAVGVWRLRLKEIEK
jgi:ABC-2 type transport system permease protein